MSGSINLNELRDTDSVFSVPNIRITATLEEYERMHQALTDFISAPLDYDLSEMCSEEEMLEMAEICKKLRKELFE